MVSVMTYIHLPGDQQSAINEVDEILLRAAVHNCLYEERVGSMHGLCLSSCGPYVATKLQRFEQTIAEYRHAKAHATRAHSAGCPACRQ